MVKTDTPIQIGAFTVKNRITFAPTVKFDYTDGSGEATERHVKHYAERAQGGTGLICVEATAVLPGGRFGENHMGLWTDAQIAGQKRIVDACHAAGSVVIIQLNHTGYVSNPACGPAIGPSSIEMKTYRGEYTTVEMSVEEIHAMQQAFVEAAVRAKKAGYDGIQLHGCHGYLINQFMSPVNNLRTDEYGGTAENRARFACEILRDIREKCGEEFLLSVRISGCEDTLKEAIAVAEEYVAAGCQYLQVSSGMSSLSVVAPFKDAAVTDIQSLGVYFKEHFAGRVPVSCVGGIRTPEQAAYLIEHEYVDTVDVAKAILADPGFANACVTGASYTKCFECQACQYGPFTPHKCPAEIVRLRK